MEGSTATMGIGAPSRAALAQVLDELDRRVSDSTDALAQGEHRAVDRLATLRDDLARTARELGADVDVADPDAAPPFALGDDPGHPAIVDAERLVREAERSMRRSTPAPKLTMGSAAARQVAFVAAFTCFLGLGCLIARLTGEIPGDAVSRVQAAQSVVAGRDPHLEALGFIWGPFPALFEVPLLWLRQWWLPMSADAIAAVIVSAAFMAGVVGQLLRWGEESGARAWMRTGVVLITVAHPLIWLFGANGMSEACWLFFLVVVARRLALWCETDDLRHLAIAGMCTGAAYLVRYESAAVFLIATAFVGMVTFRRWHPRVDDPAFGEPHWDDDRDRMRRTLLDVTLFALPAAGCIVLWAFSSWVIIGEPFAQFTSEYGNSAIVKAAGDLGMVVPDATNLGRAWFYLVQVAIAAPALLVMLAVALGSSKVRSSRVVVALVVFGSPIAVQLLFSYQGSTFPWFRYAIGAVMLSAVLAMTLGPVALSGRVLGVVALVPGLVLTWQLTSDGDFGNIDAGRTIPAISEYLDGGNPKEDSIIGIGATIASEIDHLPDVAPGSIMCDAASCFGVLVNAPRPDLYVIPADRDFEPLVADPQQFGVRYLLVQNPASGTNDAVQNAHPGLWEDNGKGLATIVREWGEEDDAQSNWRLYQIAKPRGLPRPHPTEDLTGP